MLIGEDTLPEERFSFDIEGAGEIVHDEEFGLADSASAEAALAGLPKTSSARVMSCFFQPWIKVGWTP